MCFCWLGGFRLKHFDFIHVLSPKEEVGEKKDFISTKVVALN